MAFTLSTLITKILKQLTLDSGEQATFRTAIGAASAASATAALDRANHTGTQAQSTVTGLVAALNAKAPISNAVLVNPSLNANPDWRDVSTKVASTFFVDQKTQALRQLVFSMGYGAQPNLAYKITGELIKDMGSGDPIVFKEGMVFMSFTAESFPAFMVVQETDEFMYANISQDVDGYWLISAGWEDVWFTSAAPASTPADVVTWVPSADITGTPVVEVYNFNGAFEGQLLVAAASDVDPAVYWRWNGTAWVDVTTAP